jgi:hypothetical protein
MAWERFEKTGRSFKPKVSIRGDSQIGFNAAAIEEFKLKEYPYAVLFYDKKAKQIGIKLTKNKDDVGACKLRVKEKAGASIAARAYIYFYKLNNLKVKRFDAQWDDKEKMIVVKIA